MKARAYLETNSKEKVAMTVTIDRVISNNASEKIVTENNILKN